MYPMMYYIDCHGDMWVPCHCNCCGGDDEEADSEAAGRAALLREKEVLTNTTRVTKEIIVAGKVVRTEIVEETEIAEEEAVVEVAELPEGREERRGGGYVGGLPGLA